MAHDSPEPSTTTATLAYALPPENGERAYITVNVDPALGRRANNHTEVKHSVIIENIRGKEDSVSLDTTGFQYYNHPSKHKSFQNEEEIKKEYYPESVDLLKQLTGATKVVIFDHTIRRRRPLDATGDTTPDNRQPAAAVHIDQTYEASVRRVHRHLPADEAAELVKKRFQLINLWRPISHVALDWPLALCDYRSVDVEKDPLPVDLVYPDWTGGIFVVKHNPNHKWKYLRGMTPDELVLIKCHDSIDDGSVARFTPHTAFEDPTTPKDAPLRESIELRALVFYD